MPMVDRVKSMLDKGMNIVIFTARVSAGNSDAAEARETIARWCELHLGRVLPITSDKNYQIVEMWDDRAVQIIPNTGIPIQNLLSEATKLLERILSDATILSSTEWQEQASYLVDFLYSTPYMQER